MAKIISVVNQKGGTGKSACAANLGVGLALMNKKVLVVDADPQSDVSAGFGFRDCDNSNETLTTLMEMVLSDEDIPEDCFIQHTEEGIDIICSNIGLAGTEVQLVNAMSREFVLKQILNRVKDRYDTILIDCMHACNKGARRIYLKEDFLERSEQYLDEKTEQMKARGEYKPLA